MFPTSLLRLVHAAAEVAVGLACLAPLPALAQGYPNKPVRLVVPFPPGGPLDATGRLIGQKLTEAWGQSVVVDNRPGAGGNIGADLVAKSPPDGYTVVMGALSTHAVNPSLYPSMPYDAVKDFAPITLVAITPNVLVVNPSLPVHSVQELIAYAKAHPGKLAFGSGSNGSAGHLAGELFKVDAGVDMVHVPYRGAAPALTDVIGGQVQAIFSSVTSTVEYIKAEKVRALAVTSTARSEVLPDVPTVADFVPGYEASNWWGIAAPQATPAEIVDRLNTEINTSFADDKIKARLADLGGPPLAGSPADFRKLIADETEKWGKVIRAANIKPE